MFEKLQKIYNKFPYNTNPKTNDDTKDNVYKKGLQVHNINDVAIPFNPEWKRIAVNLSGGADSAVMTYTLCKLIEENNFDAKIDVITHIRVWNNRPWAGPISIDVYNKLKEYFPNIIDERHRNYIPPELEHGAVGNILGDQSGDMVIVDSFNNYIAHDQSLDAIFNFTTKDPSVPGLKAPKRDRNIDSTVFEDLAQNRTHYWLLKPMIVTEKDWIIEQYYYHDILDLLETTRSCEGDQNNNDMFIGYDYTTYKVGQEVPECGVCYWCKERNWALEKVKNK